MNKENKKVNITAQEYRESAKMHMNTFKKTWLLFLRTGIFTLASVFAIISISMAWFSNNRSVQSSGSGVQTEVSENLVISKKIETVVENGVTIYGIKDEKILFSSSPFSVEFDPLDPAPRLIAAQHNDDCYSIDEKKTGLRYNSNPQKVNCETGVEKSKESGEELAFSPVPEYQDTDTKRYYIDYTIYIASAGKTLGVSALNATMTTNINNLLDYQKAASVDIYVDSVNKDNYRGTLNLAGLNCDNSGVLTEVNILPGDGIKTVPLNTEGYITVVLRFYIDGGLLKLKENASDPDQAYVYSKNLSLEDFSFGVSFEAVEGQT